MVDIFEDNSLLPSMPFDFSQINKSALGEVSRAVFDKVESGEEDALKVYIKAKALQEIAAGIIKSVKSYATDEAEKYGKGDSNLLGCEFNVKSGVTKYSFDHDDEWNGINEKIIRLSEQRKSREKEMINATNYAELTNKEGEVIPPAIISNGGGTVLSITIPKK